MKAKDNETDTAAPSSTQQTPDLGFGIKSLRPGVQEVHGITVPAGNEEAACARSSKPSQKNG